MSATKTEPERRAELATYRAEGFTVCTPEDPQPKAYAHLNDKLVGDCGWGCCDDWYCPDCRRSYRHEWPD